MDSVCATLFHSNVNRVSPNRTILAGEKVGIAWLLPKQPGVDWCGFLFPAFLWLRLLQVWACLHCTSCYAKPSFVKSPWLQRPRSQSCALAPAADVLHSLREVSEFYTGATNPSMCIRWQDQGRGCQKGTAVLLPSSQAVRNDLQAAAAKWGVFSLDWFHSTLAWTLMLLNRNVNLNVTL